MSETNTKEWMKPQDVWKAKNGYMTKGFSLPRSLVTDYIAACEKRGTNGTAEVRKFMQAFIDETNQLNIRAN